METKYKAIYKRDYNFGIKEEEKLKPNLEEFFKVNLEKTIGKYNLFDFIGKNYYIELKWYFCIRLLNIFGWVGTMNFAQKQECLTKK